MLPITGCAVLVVINPAGPVHTVVTVTGRSTSTAELNTTVQIMIRVTVDLIGRMGLTGSLVIDMLFGAGTIKLTCN